MNRVALRVYHSLPPTLQELCAQWHGRKLQRLRYGEVFRRELSQYAQREKWSREQWSNWQSQSLQRLLQRAVATVPYYRKLHAEGRFPIEEVVTPDDIRRLPILRKEVVRQSPLELLADDCSPTEMYEEHTSGTTGSPLRLWWSKETVQSWYACFERRVRNWAGVSLDEPWAIIGGQMIVSPNRRKPPFWVWNRPAKQLYMSCFFLSDEHMDSYVDEIVRRKIAYIYGYSNSIDTLAQHILMRGRTDVRLKVAISNAEQLLPCHRERIAKAFHCTVRDTYAPCEICVAAFECDHGTMHLSPDIGITEVVRPDGTPADFDESGELIVTSLLNQDHVLIRYMQGDRGALAPPDEKCSCGLEMPILRRIEGRTDDVLVTADGRKVALVESVFKADLCIKESQVVQVSPTKLIVNVVPADGYSERDREQICRGLRERMGDMELEFVTLTQVPRTANGKFRATINMMTKSPRNE